MWATTVVFKLCVGDPLGGLQDEIKTTTKIVEWFGGSDGTLGPELKDTSQVLEPRA